MQVTSLLSRKENKQAQQHEHHDHEHAHDQDDCSACGHDHEHTQARLTQTLAGLIFIINSFIVDWIYLQTTMVGSFSAMIGAVLLGIPSFGPL
jgi:ABC-type Zn2+ transport system substrate-binding protein/surface adhesin